jgi:hypothetical protein
MAVGEAVLTTALMLGTEFMMACPQTRHWCILTSTMAGLK